MLSTKNPLYIQRHKQIEHERKKNDIHAGSDQKRAGWPYQYQTKQTLSQKLLQEINKDITYRYDSLR